MAAMIGVAAPESRADSAIALLGKFDAEQIERVYPATDDESRGELAKLVFRLRSVDSASLGAKVASQAARLGDAVRIEGEITSIAVITVPDRLVEFLDISRLHVIDILTANESGTEQRSRIITADLPREAKPGDRIAAGGVLIELADDSSPIVFAAPRVEWFPRTLQGDGWSLLGQASVDVSGLADLATRSRMPLSARDGEMFYAMLAAAREIGQRGDLPPPRLVTAVMLLGGTETKSTAGQLQPKEAVIRGGDWIAMSLQTVQVTRVVVTEPWRQQQLGSDHYFQIDAVADLGNVDVQIERPNGEQGPPARFENRYPVSVVTAELPSFLSESIHSEEGARRRSPRSVSRSLSTLSFFVSGATRPTTWTNLAAASKSDRC